MRALLDLLVPPSCDGCGAPSAPPWCTVCDDKARAAAPGAACPRCAGLIGAGHACWSPGAPITATVAYAAWTGGVARAMVRAKLVGRREVLVAAGHLVGRAVDAAGLEVDAVVPVPTDRRRARRRGADHTIALARGVARTLGAPIVPAVRAVGRLPDTVGPGASAPDGPRAGTSHLAESRTRHRLDGAHVLVVDDVVTTGATAAGVASVLRSAGVASAALAVVGRAGSHPLGGRAGVPDAR